MEHSVRIDTFYCFTPLAEPQALKAPILARLLALDVRGTITLAHEGINATVSGTPEALDALREFLRESMDFSGASPRSSHFAMQPFQRSKVKVKRELISLGVPAHPAQCIGQLVPPSEWNALIAAPDVMIVDTRNVYEFEHGHFAGALNPGTRTFKDMVAWTEATLTDRTARIAMYCTGGIRCDKYSSYLVASGYQEIYHLHGGILAYLEQIQAAESLWQGTCFVFDERVAVGQSLVAAA